jgi:GTP-binding protein HflX
VLGELGLAALDPDQAEEGQGLIEALNKIDLLDAAERAALANQTRRNDEVVLVSAATGEGCEALLRRLDRRLDVGIHAVRLDIPLSDGKTLAWIYAHGEVVGRRDDNEAAHLSVRLSEADLSRFRHRQRVH